MLISISMFAHECRIKYLFITHQEMCVSSFCWVIFSLHVIVDFKVILFTTIIYYTESLIHQQFINCHVCKYMTVLTLNVNCVLTMFFFYKSVYNKYCIDGVAVVEINLIQFNCTSLGSEFHYTTHGFTLVSAALEGATGRTFPSMVQELFEELGMVASGLDDKERLVYNRARYVIPVATRCKRAAFIV